MSDLRVWVSREADNYWFAQGFEIDYFAEGDSWEGVQASFIEGLRRTVLLHLEKYGHTKVLFRPAPSVVAEEIVPLILAGGHTLDTTYEIPEDSALTQLHIGDIQFVSNVAPLESLV
jgi:hypothetical protein